ncbi:MAG: carboxymuconolactone decarboxylase family protein [Streptosporangiaceae bacterium]
MSALDRLADSPHWQAAGRLRVAPGDRRRLGTRAWLISKAVGWAAGIDDTRLVQTVGRNRSLARGYLRFASQVVSRSSLPRADVELLTLRTAWNIGCWYEFFHHAQLARTGGLSIDSVERIASGPAAGGWNSRQVALLTATDELHDRRLVTDPTFALLRSYLDEDQIMELCFLVGHYEMLGMVIKSAGVTPEPGAWERGPLAWAARAADDGDALTPPWLPAVNKVVTNRVQGLWAPYLPPYAMIIHRGRTSGRVYRTPVTAFRTGDRLVVPLFYGDRSDWVRNLLASSRGGAERLGRVHRLANVRISDVATDGDLVPAFARPVVGLVKILIADLT